MVIKKMNRRMIGIIGLTIIYVILFSIAMYLTDITTVLLMILIIPALLLLCTYFLLMIFDYTEEQYKNITISDLTRRQAKIINNLVLSDEEKSEIINELTKNIEEPMYLCPICEKVLFMEHKNLHGDIICYCDEHGKFEFPKDDVA